MSKGDIKCLGKISLVFGNYHAVPQMEAYPISYLSSLFTLIHKRKDFLTVNRWSTTNVDLSDSYGLTADLGPLQVHVDITFLCVHCWNFWLFILWFCGFMGCSLIVPSMFWDTGVFSGKGLQENIRGPTAFGQSSLYNTLNESFTCTSAFNPIQTS